MRGKSSPFKRGDSDEPGFAVPGLKKLPNHLDNENTPEEVIGEVGLVLIIFLGLVVAINLVLATLYFG